MTDRCTRTLRLLLVLLAILVAGSVVAAGSATAGLCDPGDEHGLGGTGHSEDRGFGGTGVQSARGKEYE